MDSLPGCTGADGTDARGYGDKRHTSCVHHCGDITHCDVVCAAAATTTVCPLAFVHISLRNVDP